MTTFIGTLEDAARFFKFGFVVSADGSQKAFLGRDKVETAGFNPNELTADSQIKVEVMTAPKGLKVTRVVSVNGVAGTAPVPKSVATKPTEPAKVTVDLFRASLVDHNKDKGLYLYKVIDTSGHLVQYIVADDDGLVTSQLGWLTLPEARLAIGRVVEAPQTEPGSKTNDPALSKSMQGSSNGGGGKKAA